MTPAEILAIMQLVAVLEPQAINLINHVVTSFQNSGMSPEERQKTLNDLAAALQPMIKKI